MSGEVDQDAEHLRAGDLEPDDEGGVADDLDAAGRTPQAAAAGRPDLAQEAGSRERIDDLRDRCRGEPGTAGEVGARLRSLGDEGGQHRHQGRCDPRGAHPTIKQLHLGRQQVGPIEAEHPLQGRPQRHGEISPRSTARSYASRRLVACSHSVIQDTSARTALSLMPI